jgi:hypothetical protein
MNRVAQPLLAFTHAAVVCGLLMGFIWWLGRGNFGPVAFYGCFYAVLLIAIAYICFKDIISSPALLAQPRPVADE